MRTTIVIVAIATCVAAAVPARAQQPGPPPMQGPGAPGPDATPDMSPQEIQRLFDAYMVMQAQDALALSEAQYAQFLTRLRALQETRRRNLVERNRLMGELQRMTAPRAPKPPDDAVLRERLAELQELESRSAAELRKAYNGIDEILDVRQQARFRVLEEQVERRKVELLLRARQNNRLPQNPRRPPPGTVQ